MGGSERELAHSRERRADSCERQQVPSTRCVKIVFTALFMYLDSISVDPNDDSNKKNIINEKNP